MKAIVKKGESMVVSFEGYDYMFPADKPVSVTDELYKFVIEGWPMSFKKYEGKKTEVIPTISRKETKSSFPKEARFASKDMMVTPPVNRQVMGIDNIPTNGTVDADGVEWTGEGLEEDTI